MAIKQLHHINYLVRDLNQSISYFSRLLQQQPVTESLPSRDVITARYELSGVLFILVQPTTDTGVVAKTLAQKGEGVFLLSLAVDDLDSTVEALESEQIRIDSDSRRTGLDDWSVCDLKPSSDSRTTIQLCQEKHSK